MNKRAFIEKKNCKVSVHFIAEWEKVCKRLKQSGYDLSKIQLVGK